MLFHLVPVFSKRHWQQVFLVGKSESARMCHFGFGH